MVVRRMRKTLLWVALAGLFMLLIGCSEAAREKKFPISSSLTPPPESSEVVFDTLPKDYYYVQVEDAVLTDEAGEVIRRLFFQERVFLIRKGVQRTLVEDYAGNQGYVERSVLGKDFISDIGEIYSGVEYGAYAEKNKPYKDYKPVRAVYMPPIQLENVDLFLQRLEGTSINSIVIDYKNDYDQILFPSPATQEIKIDSSPAFNESPEEFMTKIKEKGFHTIARIVVFRSDNYVLAYPKHSVMDEAGELYYSEGSYWVSPYCREMWDYIVKLSNEALAYGFDEIQFDHLNFPVADGTQLNMRNLEDESRPEAIQKFLFHVQSSLDNKDAIIGVNVFGWSAVVPSDIDIGQQWEALSAVSDVISPMFYPSLFSAGNLGLDRPQREPYETIKRASQYALERNENLPTPAFIRPWLQAYDYDIAYGEEEIAAQIQALKDLGIYEYLLWNPDGQYELGGLNDASTNR